ncbi:MAG: hypothetical protein KatS3mg104_3023 [Phycisphaerae bacterium]|jgi:thiol:disulfide interchange protein DsbD|nr:MAG: hypothetical protein KatS3mg104_3023 [Phycisphaerae bacterium]
MIRAFSLFVWLISTLALAQPVIEPVAIMGPVAPGKSTSLTIRLEIPEGYHAQSHTPLSENLIPFEVVLQTGPGIQVGPIEYPQPQIKNYPLLGPTSVYSGVVEVRVPLMIAADVPMGSLSVSADVTYQICDDQGTCYAPQTRTLPILRSDGEVSSSVVDKLGSTPPTEQVAEFLGIRLSLNNIGAAIGIGLFVGLLFNVMPCVLPVLPLKIMGFYEASQHHRGRAITLGASFSAGLILVFVGLGLLVLLSKTIFGQSLQWGQWFAYAPVVWGMTLLLVVLGAGMLGAFSIRLPTSIYGLSFRHDTHSGNVAWGALTAVLSTPCTAPMFAPLLAYATAQPLHNGFLTMLSVGVGMAMPYFILSAFPEVARSFPRTGPVSELIKQSLAFPMLATAAWLIGPTLVGDPQHWWLVVAVIGWGVLFVGIRSSQLLRSSGAILLTTGLAVLFLASSIYIAVQFNPIRTDRTPDSSTPILTPGEWVEYSEPVLEQALKKGPVLIKFTASWCANCQVIEATVFKNSDTLRQLREKGVYMIKADLTRSSAAGWAKLNDLGQTGIPLTAVYLPGQPQPVLLSSLYTSSDLLKLIK